MNISPALIISLIAVLTLTCPLVSCVDQDHRESAPIDSFRVVDSYPHDQKAFTQGLVFRDGYLYEGTGLYGRSSIRQVRIEDGKVIRMKELPDNFFGEGVTIFGDKIVQLTWKSHTGFVYDMDFNCTGSFSYPTEGWGLTGDDRNLIMSDGSSTLYFLDPQNYTTIGELDVTDGAKKVSGLNELEYINGEIWANVFPTNQIVRISPKTGEVLRWLVFDGLEDSNSSEAVLNGIAYDQSSDRIFVTGKLWSKIYRIKLETK